MNLRKELAKLIQSIEKKQEQYAIGENTDLNKNSHYFALVTVVESFKRAVESMNKRIESYVYYSSGCVKSDNDKILIEDAMSKQFSRTLEVKKPIQSAKERSLYSTLVFNEKEDNI